MIPGYRDFEFDLPGALLAKLIESFQPIEKATLCTESVSEIPDAQGVYQLFLDNNLVYIGKTDEEAGLRKRLARHASKILHRTRLDPARVSFKAIRIYVFTAIDLETQLIAHYGGCSEVAWNGSGFGSNDPGRERDTTTYKPGHFDATFPIDIDRELALAIPAPCSAAAGLIALKDAVPYVLRFANAGGKSRKSHPDLVGTNLPARLAGSVSARQMLQAIVACLPKGWQATRLPSHLIVYKENKDYPQGEVIARSS